MDWQEEITKQMADTGYTLGSPNDALYNVDKVIVEWRQCPECILRSLVFLPFTREDPYSYVVYGLCGECGYLWKMEGKR